jgi:hypothetical protein
MNVTIAVRPADLPARFEPLLLEFFEVPKQMDGWCVLGTDGACELRVDRGSGGLTAFDPEGKLPARFVNSCVSQLGAFIAVYGRYVAETPPVDDEAARFESVARLRGTFAELDPAALLDPENWWSVVLEQIEDGLL